jgi:hypothetical protein
MTENNPADPVDPVPPVVPVAPVVAVNSRAYTGPAADQDAKTMGMLCHLLGIFTGFIGPLIIWLIKKESYNRKSWIAGN